jgi:hypothetical protein
MVNVLEGPNKSSRRDRGADATMSKFNYRKRRFEAGFDRKEGSTCLYRITEHEGARIVRTFTGTVSRQQRAATKSRGMNTNERQVERWCELRQDRLPPDGGRVEINLKEVRKH